MNLWIIPWHALHRRVQRVCNAKNQSSTFDRRYRTWASSTCTFWSCRQEESQREIETSCFHLTWLRGCSALNRGWYLARSSSSWVTFFKSTHTLKCKMECPVCYETCDTKEVFECSHKFCSTCIEKIVTFKKRCPDNSHEGFCLLCAYDEMQSLQLKCPMCRSTLPSWPQCMQKILNVSHIWKHKTAWIIVQARFRNHRFAGIQLEIASSTFKNRLLGRRMQI